MEQNTPWRQLFRAVFLIVWVMTGCNTASVPSESISSIPAVAIDNEGSVGSISNDDSLSVTTSGFYEEYFNRRNYERDTSFAYTRVPEGTVFGFHGANMYFVFRNPTDEDRVIEGVYIEVEEIALDTAPVCFVERYSDDQGSFYVRPMNIGWGDMQPGVLTLSVPEEYQQYFDAAEYSLETTLLSPASRHADILLLSSENIISYPEDELDITLMWRMEAASHVVYAWNERIVFTLGKDGISSNLNVWGLEDGPRISFNPSLEESVFYKKDAILLPAQTSVGLFTRIGAMKSCHVVAEFTFVLDNGAELVSDLIEADFRIPIIKEEALTTIWYDTVFLPLSTYENDWAVVSPLDEASLVLRE